MKTIDQILKIKATLLYILNFFPEGIDYIKLFKILYFAQQEHLVKYGRPIVEESFYALKHGPVPSFSYKAFQAAEGKQEMVKDFSEFLKGITVITTTNDVIIVSNNDFDVDMDELSISDVKCLDYSIDKHKDIAPYDLSELSHDVAWEEAYNRAQNDPEKNMMTLIDIAKAGNALDSTIAHIREHQLIKKAFS
jgi:uncharacterized phage-associated protein